MAVSVLNPAFLYVPANSGCVPERLKVKRGCNGLWKAFLNTSKQSIIKDGLEIITDGIC